MADHRKVQSLEEKADAILKSNAEIKESLAAAARVTVDATAILDTAPNGGVYAKAIDHDELGRFGWDSMGEQLRAVADLSQSRGQKHDKRLTKEHFEKAVSAHPVFKKSATGLGEFVGSDGGFLLAPTFINEIFRIAHSQFNMMDECDVRQIAGPSVKYRSVAETSRATGSRRGGLTGYWVDEADTFTASKPTFRNGELKPHKLQVLYYATEELLADGGQFLTQEVANFAADEINFLTSNAIIDGSGAGQPRGVLSSPALVSVAKETGQGAATILYENVVKMWSRLHASSMPKAKWYINQSAFPQLQTMTLAVGTGGLPVYLPPAGASGAPYGTLFGRPVMPVEQCKALGTVGDILLMDMSQYIVATRGALQSAVSVHVEFLTDQQVFKFTFRVDGNTRWHTTLTPFNDTTKTQSPYVALAARA